MFYGRALYFISVCWPSVLCGSVLHVHNEVQASGKGYFLLYSTRIKPDINYREYESTNAVSLKIQDSLFHCLRERVAGSTQ